MKVTFANEPSPQPLNSALLIIQRAAVKSYLQAQKDQAQKKEGA